VMGCFDIMVTNLHDKNQRAAKITLLS
jgi:hypothetical protein